MVKNWMKLSISYGVKVATDAKSRLDIEERCRQMIQEPEFLGGDMEYTHMVKCLEYSIYAHVQKVRR
ncbi:hypothetical protein NPIL_453711 [Nephila pilipes]|uniref:RED-like N-terminal domain-containing protein n=1 Tax=Nephila pilipes TaxID=299642 RepID=A0A8X6PIY5_NEPPI|nr:hypothetical protein NPIL_453711 [Nephila pilipes]